MSNTDHSIGEKDKGTKLIASYLPVIYMNTINYHYEGVEMQYGYGDRHQ